jgi:hypothetical protein
MKKPICLLIILTPCLGWCQTVTNVVARSEGEQVQISYDLSGNAGESYEMKISCSRDGGKTFTVTPMNIGGAVNRWEAPGNGKSVTWEAKKDLGQFEGDLQFKVIATGKEGSKAPLQKANVVSSTAAGSSSGSLSAENSEMTFTIASVFNVNDGFKVFFKIKAKSEIEVGFSPDTKAEDQFGNIYVIHSSDIESLGVTNGKTRKFMANARKEGEMILKLSKLNGGTIEGRTLKNLTISSTAGTLQLNDLRGL